MGLRTGQGLHEDCLKAFKILAFLLSIFIYFHRDLFSKFEDSTSLMYRCKTCVFASCASCGTTAKKQTQLKNLKKEGQTYLWYCSTCQRCTFCGQWKNKSTDVKDGGSQHHSEVCRACEHPQCHSCGDRHAGKKALYDSNPNIKGTKFARRWYCSKNTCQKERARKLV